MTKEELKQMPIQERKEYILGMLENKTHNFSMFSKAGGKRVKSLIKKCVKKIMGKAMRQQEFEDYVTKEVKKVGSQEKYSEVGDTAVREVIYWWLELAIEMADYEWDYFEYDY
jgi:hypothetical protein